MLWYSFTPSSPSSLACWALAPVLQMSSQSPERRAPESTTTGGQSGDLNTLLCGVALWARPAQHTQAGAGDQQGEVPIEDAHPRTALEMAGCGSVPSHFPPRHAWAGVPNFTEQALSQGLTGSGTERRDSPQSVKEPRRRGHKGKMS